MSSSPPSTLTGVEPFTGLDARVVDFWRFAMSDLRTNTVRGVLAEFLVREAVGGHEPREEWAAYDVVTPDGITIEVKSSAYLQVWAQTRPSRIVFSGLRGRTWTVNGHAAEPTYNAQVYVFCVQTADDHEHYDPLDVHQWDFYVLPVAVLIQLGCTSLGLAAVRQHAGAPIPFGALNGAIRTAVGSTGVLRAP